MYQRVNQRTYQSLDLSSVPKNDTGNELLNRYVHYDYDLLLLHYNNNQYEPACGILSLLDIFFYVSVTECFLAESFVQNQMDMK